MHSIFFEERFKNNQSRAVLDSTKNDRQRVCLHAAPVADRLGSTEEVVKIRSHAPRAQRRRQQRPIATVLVPAFWKR